MTHPGRTSTLALALAASACLAAEPAPDGTAFPPGFLWGTATAAHQVEGGNDRNQWWDFEQVPGNIKHGDKSGAACDHWNLYPQDLDLGRAIGMGAYRFSVEWSRIEAEDGTFDAAAIARYRAMAEACRARGIVPMVTLFHFSIPRWAAAQGGFLNPAVVERFGRFARVMARHLGDLVDLWCTINEPTVYMAAGYLAGVHPPGEADTKLAVPLMKNLMKAHGAAYRALREADLADADGDGAPTRIGFAHHMRVFQAWDRFDPLDHAMVHAIDRVMNKAWLDVLSRGWTAFVLPGSRLTVRIDEPELAGTMDYLGLNYYSRDLIDFDPSQPGSFARRLPEGAPVTDLGWEIHPRGLYDLLLRVKRYRLPVYITENGLADAAGTRRAAFLHDHLAWIAAAIAEGVDVRGYFHWSLLDNFEWADGFEPRFGLYAVDFATQARTLTAGGAYFGAVAGANRLEPLPGQVAAPGLPSQP